MAVVVAHDRVAGLLSERPWWQQQNHSLLLTVTAPDHGTAMALLDEIRAHSPGRSDASVCTELRGVDLRIQVRSPGHVGLTGDALALMCEIDNALAAGSVHLPARIHRADSRPWSRDSDFVARKVE